jgi:hypothetical protein
MLNDLPLTVANERRGDDRDPDSGIGIPVEEANLRLSHLSVPEVLAFGGGYGHIRECLATVLRTSGAVATDDGVLGENVDDATSGIALCRIERDVVKHPLIRLAAPSGRTGRP